jgi:hypothetical protein
MANSAKKPIESISSSPSSNDGSLRNQKQQQQDKQQSPLSNAKKAQKLNKNGDGECELQILLPDKSSQTVKIKQNSTADDVYKVKSHFKIDLFKNEIISFNFFE